MGAWGRDIDNWVGKTLKVQLAVQNVRGLLRTVIYGIPLDEE